VAQVTATRAKGSWGLPRRGAHRLPVRGHRGSHRPPGAGARGPVAVV